LQHTSSNLATLSETRFTVNMRRPGRKRLTFETVEIIKVAKKNLPIVNENVSVSKLVDTLYGHQTSHT
jgi:hypothetical protein